MSTQSDTNAFIFAQTVQDHLNKLDNHNYVTNRFVQEYQYTNACGATHLMDACQENQDATIVCVLPRLDSEVPQRLVVDENVSPENLVNISIIQDEITPAYAAISLPVLKLIVTPQWIVLSALNEFSEEDLKAFNTNYTGHGFTGKELLSRYRNIPQRIGYMRDNEFSLYVEYINEQYNWESISSTHKVFELFNPCSVGFHTLMFTPHY